MANGPLQKIPPWLKPLVTPLTVGGGTFRLAPGRHFPMSGPWSHATRAATRGGYICQLASAVKGKRSLKHLDQKIWDFIDPFLYDISLPAFKRQLKDRLVNAAIDYPIQCYVMTPRLGLYNLDLQISAYLQCTIDFGLTSVYLSATSVLNSSVFCVHELTVYCCFMFLFCSFLSCCRGLFLSFAGKISQESTSTSYAADRRLGGFLHHHDMLLQNL